MSIAGCSPWRIALVVESYEPDGGGPSGHVAELAAYLDERGHAVELIVGGAHDPRVLAALEREDLDLVDVHGPPWPALPLRGRHRRAAVVATIHGGSPRSVDPMQGCLDSLDAAVVVDVAPARWHGGQPLPGLDDGRINLVSLARLDRRNRHDLVVHALARARAEVPGLRLLLTGDGPDREWIAAHVPPTMADDVRFLGAWDADPADVIASAHVHCFTHGLASESAALLAGMAAALPVIYEDSVLTREMLVHGSDGLCVPPGDAGAYARAMVELAGDAAVRGRLGESARRRAAPRAWTEVGPQVEAAYRDAVARRHRRGTLPSRAVG